MPSANRRASRLSRRAFLGAAALSGCVSSSRPGAVLQVAAASNLSEVFREIGQSFTAKTGIPISFSFGSTAQLARQCQDGAPYDLFAAADKSHITGLRDIGVLTADSCTLYARGQLALWVPDRQLGIAGVADLTRPTVRAIAIASPNAAPYGQAAVEVLRKLDLWDQLEQKVVYATSISMAKQFASSGNADAAFTAWSLVHGGPGDVIRIPENLHQPIEQWMGILRSAHLPKAAAQFRDFLRCREGKNTLAAAGYAVPPACGADEAPR